MRDIMQIVEAEQSSRELREVAPQSIAELRSEVASAMHQLSSEEVVPDAFIRKVAKELKSLRRLGHLTVFRLLGVTNPEAIRMAHLGQHWTLDWEALSHHGNFYVPNNSKLYAMQALVDPADIIIPITIAYRFLFPEEDEVFVEDGSRVYVMFLYEYPHGEKPIDGFSGVESKA